jgi:hypothetical protein
MAHLTGVGAYREQTKNEYQVKNAGKAKKNPGSAKSNPSRPGVALRRTASLPLAYVEERRRFRLPMSRPSTSFLLSQDLLGQDKTGCPAKPGMTSFATGFSFAAV